MKATIAGTSSSEPLPETAGSTGGNLSMIIPLIALVIAVIAGVLAIIAMFLPTTTTGAYVKSAFLTVTPNTPLPGGNINGTIFYLTPSSPSASSSPSSIVVDNSIITRNTNFALVNTNVTTDIVVQLINFPNLEGAIDIVLGHYGNQLTAYINTEGQLSYSVQTSYPYTIQNGKVYHPTPTIINTVGLSVVNATTPSSTAEAYLYQAPPGGAGNIKVIPNGYAVIITSSTPNPQYYVGLYTDGIGTASGYNYLVNNTTGVVNYGFGPKASFTGGASSYPYVIQSGGFALLIFDKGVIKAATTQ